MYDKLMTLEEVGDYLQLSQSTVYKLVQEGRMPALKIGGVWRFRVDIVDRWLTNQQTNRRLGTKRKKKEVPHGKAGSG